MRHILLPTDLSEDANNALAYARELALEFDATITLAHIQQSPGDVPELAKQAADLRAAGLTVATELHSGMPVSQLKHLIYGRDFDLVVMGCQGKQAGLGKVFGSTTTSLMDEITLPLLAVPLGATPTFPRRIMWAADRQPPIAASTLHPLFDLVDRATTELQVFHYQEKGETELPEARFKHLLSDVRYDFFYQLADGERVGGAIHEFVREHRIDLLAMLHRQSTWLSRVMVESQTRRTVATSPVPILILQETGAF
jgi:nucleotide-binding universal stress UspA family protein